MRSLTFPVFLFLAGIAAAIYSALDHDLIGVIFGYVIAVVGLDGIRETTVLEAEAKKTLS